MNNQNNLRKNSEPYETEIEDFIEEENVYKLRKNTNYIHIQNNLLQYLQIRFISQINLLSIN